MQINIRNQTYEIDVGFAMFLLGLYVGIDVHTLYVCLTHVIRTALDRMLKWSADRGVSGTPVTGVPCPSEPSPRA